MILNCAILVEPLPSLPEDPSASTYYPHLSTNLRLVPKTLITWAELDIYLLEPLLS